MNNDDSYDESAAGLLKNAIKEAIDKFGNDLDTKEKMAVLVRVIAELVEK